MTRRDMSKEALKAKRSAINNQLQQLRQALSSLRTPNIAIDELCELGVKPVRAELAPDKELLEFEPCFFLPQPTSALLEHPFIPGEWLSDLEQERTYETILAETIRKYPRLENPEEEARKEYLWNWEFSLLGDHIDSHVYGRRSGINTSDGPGSLGDLTPLQYSWHWLPKAEGVSIVDPGDRIGDGLWYSSEAYLDESLIEDEFAATPHAIIKLYVRYRGNDTSLTHGEVCGLLHHMDHWYSCEECEQHAMVPVNIRFFFTGPGLF